jgi:hypothetical protein
MLKLPRVGVAKGHRRRGQVAVRHFERRLERTSANSNLRLLATDQRDEPGRTEPEA